MARELDLWGGPTEPRDWLAMYLKLGWGLRSIRQEVGGDIQPYEPQSRTYFDEPHKQHDLLAHFDLYSVLVCDYHKLDRLKMPSSYTPQQKAQIAQFVNFTSSKDSVAAKVRSKLREISGCITSIAAPA